MPEKRGRNAEGLAREFEVSVRTIKRDLTALEVSGVPLWSRPGPGGGYGARPDAAKAVGINPREALDIDKGVTKLNGVGRVPFVPDGPDTELYKRLMQVLPYVDGRQAVPVEVIPQHASNG